VLDHKPATARLLGLLPSARAEVRVAAAWALRKLAVPDTLPAVLAFAEGRLRAARAPGAAVDDDQLGQLVQFLGDARHRPADPLLRRFVPRGVPLGVEARAAAAYALGLLHEGRPVPELATVLAGRLAAVNPGDVESDRFRRMCAAALGRMKAADALPTLRTFCPTFRPSLEQVSNASGWAIERITGEKMPPPEVVELNQVDWFLTPFN
jgi:HEAT repeat protein